MSVPLTRSGRNFRVTLCYRKKNAPYLYDLMITHALDWPSLTCQWFPDKESCVMHHSPSPLVDHFPNPVPPTSHTRSTACFSARTRPAKPQTTCKSPQYRSRPAADRARTSSTAAPTTRSAASSADTRFLRRRRAFASCSGSTTRARSTARATCHRTRT